MRLPGVDGLRATAALWVVLFHMYAFSGVTFSRFPGVDLILRSGSTGVSLFLVLSGFCLFLPFAGGRTTRFKVRDFFVRRCRRLMPAYYASLAFAVVLYVGAGAWLGFQHMDFAQVVWQIIAHGLLIHTLFPSTFYTLNGAYWSLGLEWQLYLGLPLLIWLICRIGLTYTAAIAIGCNVVYRIALSLAIAHGAVAPQGMIATDVLPNLLPGRWAEFVFGMIAADLYATGRLARWARSRSFQFGALGALVVLVPVGFRASGWSLSHLVFGGVFFVVLALVLQPNNILSRIFSWPPLVAIGIMSYSLYLVHQPVVQGLAYLLRTDAHASPPVAFFALLLLLPFILFIAWVLFVTVERRTLGHQQPTDAGKVTAILFPQFTLPRRPEATSLAPLPTRPVL
jgi:peptidoglycan/LPS O-acetylase OafA/YrhL